MPSGKMLYLIEGSFHEILCSLMGMLVSPRSHSSSSTEPTSGGGGGGVAAGIPDTPPSQGEGQTGLAALCCTITSC